MRFRPIGPRARRHVTPYFLSLSYKVRRPIPSLAAAARRFPPTSESVASIVRRSFSHNGTSLYAMALSGEGRFHVLCKETQQVEEIDGAPADQLRAAIKRVQESLVARGYKDVAYSVEFFGVSQQATAKLAPIAKATAPALQTV